MRKIICKVCGKEKEVPNYYSNAQYCSMKCYHSTHSIQREIRICSICGNKFTTSVNSVKKCCSKKCAGFNRRGKPSKKRVSIVELVCHYCGKKFMVPEYKNWHKYCSRKCAYTAMREFERSDEYKLKMAKVISKICHNGSNYKQGHIYLSRLNATYRFRSSYEEMMLKIFDTLSFIKSVDYEKIYIPYSWADGTKHNYIVDFVVTLQCGFKILIEVKPSIFCCTEKNFKKFLAAIEYAENHNMIFTVFTNNDLFSNTNSVETTLSRVNDLAMVATQFLGDEIVQTDSMVKNQKQAEMTCSPDRNSGYQVIDRWKKYQFLDFVEKANQNIIAKTLRMQCTFLIVGNDGARIIRQLQPNYKPAAGLDGITPTGPYELGTLDGRVVVHDPLITTSSVIFGWKGDSLIQGAFLFAPYIPLFTTSTLITATDLKAQKGFLSSAAYKVINNGAFCAGTISGLA